MLYLIKGLEIINFNKLFTTTKKKYFLVVVIINVSDAHPVN